MVMTDVHDNRGAEYTAVDIEDWARELENDATHTAMRQQMEERHRDLVAMQDRPDLAEHLLRAGVVVTMNSPLLGNLCDEVISDIRPFSTDITATPMEQGVEAQCDELEKWFAVWKQTANPGWKHSRDFLYHLFLSNYAVALLKIRPDVKTDASGKPEWADFPWEIIIPDPSTCFFPIEGAPFIPSVLARRYEQSVRSMERMYAGAGPFADSMPIWRDGNVDILPLGDDYKVGNSGKYAGSAKRGEMVQMIELYTPTQTYIYCATKSGRGENDRNPRQGINSTLVWYGDNLTGGVPAVVGSGLSQPLRTAAVARERLQPGFRALYQDVKNMNRAYATLATIAENAKPELINQKGPATLEAESRYTGKNSDQLVNDGTGPAVVDIAGERMMQWEMQEEKNLILIADKWDKQAAQDSQSWRQLSDPEVLRDIKANVYLTSAESTRRRLSNVLTNYDFMWESLLSMAETSARKLNRAFPLWSTQDVVFGKSKQGSGNRTVSGGELVTLDGSKEFKHTLSVVTRSMSAAEQRMRREDMNAQRAAGSATFMQVLEIDYDDTEQQLIDLALDRMLEHSEITFGASKVDRAVQDAIKFIGGVYIPMAGQGAPTPAPGQPDPSTNPGPAPQGMPPMRPAAVGAAAGGSMG